MGDITMDDYVDAVRKVIDHQGEPVILVGHSMGGGVITQVAEISHRKIKTLVYVTGFLPKSGQTIQELVASEHNRNSLLRQNIELSEDRRTTTVRKDSLREVFYGDCSEDVVSTAKQSLVPNAIAPILSPIQTTTENFGRVPRIYIECLSDRCLTPELQRMMYTAQDCNTVLSLQSSHSPFFSVPEDLVGHLTSSAVIG